MSFEMLSPLEDYLYQTRDDVKIPTEKKKAPKKQSYKERVSLQYRNYYLMVSPTIKIFRQKQ